MGALYVAVKSHWAWPAGLSPPRITRTLDLVRASEAALLNGHVVEPKVENSKGDSINGAYR